MNKSLDWELSYTCTIYDRELVSRSGRSRHVRFVHTNHQLGCGECTKTCRSKDSLRRHERKVHQLVRQQTQQRAGTVYCDTCQKVYRRKEDLKIHLSINHQVGPPINMPSPTPVVTTAPALSPTPIAVQVAVIDFEDMMFTDNDLDLLEMEPI
ncbi:unnamed protein product [Mytilus coruscus]|uniref:C2H2-type domain-containing protein n=1 Tax=Mytilus coruscus TaxID=42192 RepID=A0A6J8BYE1_MYTCO|nr:unnamed protein product [Mytilus coruscus]